MNPGTPSFLDRANWILVLVFVGLVSMCPNEVNAIAAAITGTTPAPLPVEQNATCGKGQPLYTRHDIWAKCFMRLGGMHAPRSGELDVNKVNKFRADHLYMWERWFTPSAEDIIKRCDQPPLDGWVTQQEFEGTANRFCLADADAICHAKTVCERETRHLDGPQ